MNPFLEKPMDIWESFVGWKQLYPKAYDKNDTDPYTKVRLILMNGTEFEANWFSHQFARHCDNNDLRREIATTRRVEKQQQMMLSVLKPINETILEHTIGYEQLAVDLTAVMAQREPDKEVKAALDFALLEDFDHLYRYADLLDMEHGVHAERLVGKYTEIMPGRPTVAEHRFPVDNVRKFVDFTTCDPLTKLHVSIITAAEQQTMNYYMNVANLYSSDIGRRLYQEIGLIEEQHVSQYESLMDPNCTWLEGLLCHEYTECYLYYSCYMDETHPQIKQIYENCFMQELVHLHRAAQLLKKYEKKEWQQVIPGGEFPDLLEFKPNIDYVREVLRNTVWNTSRKEKYLPVDKMPDEADFFRFQKIINGNCANTPSHEVIEQYIKQHGQDYRFETEKNPIAELQNRTKDNIKVGRVPEAKKA